MRAPIAALLLYLGIAPFALAGSRITFERVLPAPHDLGDAESIALVHAIGDHVKVESFVDHFVHQVNRSGFLHIRDARQEKERNADALLQVKTFTCETRNGGGDVGVTDVDGNRVRRPHVWVDAMCVARIDVTAGKQKSSFYARGEGTSPRVEELNDDVRGIALEQAARYAAVEAAARITPRRVRESIPLDESAPAFEEGMVLIDVERFADARKVWEAALKSQPRSAPLHFNLAALCEALGDRKAAEQHYTAARGLAPGETRYAAEWKLFRRRASP